MTQPENVSAIGTKTSCDSFLDGRFRAIQPKSGPRAAIDALFLAASIPVKSGNNEYVLEAGMGTGVASLALAARIPDIQITGVEIQPCLIALAGENIKLNGFSSRIEAIEADLTGSRSALLDAGLKPETYTHVMANPPFYPAQKVRISSNESTARAYVAEEGALEAWIKFLASMAAPRGTATLIHRAEALPELLAGMHPRFGGLRIFPLFPHAGEPATRVIVQGIKGSRAPMVLAQGLVVHEADGQYTRLAERVLREGEGLGLI